MSLISTPARGEVVVLDLHDGLGGIRDAEIHHRIHPDADVVLRDRVLGRDVQGHDTQIHLPHPLDPEGQQEDESGTLGPGELAQAEDDTPFVLEEDAQAGEDRRAGEDRDGDENDTGIHGFSRAGGTTRYARPTYGEREDDLHAPRHPQRRPMGHAAQAFAARPDG